MHPACKIILICIFHLFFCAGAVAKVNDGSPEIPFGLYQDSVRAILARQNAEMSFQTNGYYDQLYINYKNYQHAGNSCGLFLTFYKNKLGKYVIADYRGTKSRFKQLEKTITAKYGHAIINTNKGGRSTRTWILKAGEMPSQLKQITIELVKDEHGEMELLEEYVSEEEFDWEQKNPQQ